MAYRVLVILAIIGLAQCKLLDLSCHQIRLFVDGHNSRRLEVANGSIHDQPSAEKMKSVVWDEELAAKAAQWAAQNPSKHNPDVTVKSGRFGETGENLHRFGTTDISYKLNADAVLGSWFKEHEYWTFGPLKESDFSISKKKIGHYTQMIWSDSTHIGCAISQHNDGILNKFTVVCNYGPAGNYLGQEPYRKGHDGVGKLVCGAGNCTKQYGKEC